MPLKNTFEAYGWLAKLFHWIAFLIIAGLLTAGFVMTGMENGPDKFKVYGLHKSFGIALLTLVGLRLGWKLVNVAPLLPESMKQVEKFLAHAAHWGLYALMFAMPLSGWMMSSAAGFPVSVFGWFTLPDLVAPDKALQEALRDLHGLLAWALIVLASLHALAALLHHFYHKDNVLRRMLPFARIGLWLAIGVLCAPGLAWAEIPAYEAVKEKSTLKFYAIQNGAPVEGRFETFTAEIRFDAEHLDQSAVTVEVATGSLSVKNSDVDTNLRLPEWLSVEAFPKAVFKSTKITRMPMSDNYYAEGTLSLRDKTLPVVLNFQLKAYDDAYLAEGSTTLHRDKYGIGQGQWAKDDVIKNEVRVEFRVFAKKK